jgi:hypothetical protein
MNSRWHPLARMKVLSLILPLRENIAALYRSPLIGLIRQVLAHAMQRLTSIRGALGTILVETILRSTREP